MWKDVENYEGIYWINKFGEIKNRFNKIKKTTTSNYCEYPSISLEKNGKRKIFMVHRLVAKHFITNLENKLQVNHKDRDKHNYNSNNLEWVTAKENMKHYYNNGGVKYNNQTYKGKFGKEHNRSLVIECNGVIYYGISEASRLTGINISTIHYGLKNNKPCKGMHFQIAKI